MGDDDVELSIVGDVLDQDDELVAAHPGHRVDRADRLAQARRHRPEQLVANVVAGGVVHGLEMVEVEEHDADVLAFPPATFEGVSHAVLQQAPVGQPRQVVVHRLEGQSPLGRLLLGYVPDDLGHAGHMAGPVPERGQADRNLHPGTVLADPHRLDPADDLAVPCPRQQRGRLDLPVRRDQYRYRGAERLFFLPPEQLSGGVVPDLDDVARPDADDGLVAFLGDRSQQSLALDGSVPGWLAFGHDDVELVSVVPRQRPRLERDAERPLAHTANPPRRRR